MPLTSDPDRQLRELPAVACALDHQVGEQGDDVDPEQPQRRLDRGRHRRLVAARLPADMIVLHRGAQVVGVGQPAGRGSGDARRTYAPATSPVWTWTAHSATANVCQPPYRPSNPSTIGEEVLAGTAPGRVPGDGNSDDPRRDVPGPCRPLPAQTLATPRIEPTAGAIGPNSTAGHRHHKPGRPAPAPALCARRARDVS